MQRVTAGNASGLNDGAAAIIIASEEAVKKYGLKPLFKVVSWGQGGVDPKIMGTGPIPASRQALSKAGLTIDDMDLIEANEAFAAQSIAVARELGFDMSKVNVNGGAIAIGHPVGCSGARIIVTLLHEMMKRPDAKKGLATLCIGGGLGVAAIFEKGQNPPPSGRNIGFWGGAPCSPFSLLPESRFARLSASPHDKSRRRTSGGFHPLPFRLTSGGGQPSSPDRPEKNKMPCRGRSYTA